jgi:LPXTG-motif cell wall-anchored protein
MRKSVLFILMGFLMVLFPVSVSAGFAPADRQTFQCVTNEDCPGPTFITFNSFTDAPNPDAPAGGDERAFFEAANSSSSTQNSYTDNLSVQDGQRIQMRVYIHNDANPNLMGVDGATAHNVSVIVQLPTSGSSNTATAYISSTNSRPLQISDTVSFSSSVPVSVSLDRNSPISITKRTNNGAGDFVTATATGVELTDENNFKVNLGDWPGGFNRHGILTFMAIVHTNTVQPAAFVCSSLERSTIDNNRSTFTTRSNGTAAGATVSSYTFTVKDSSGRVVDNSTVNTSAQNAAYNFNQSGAGTYIVSSVVNSDKGSVNCTSQQVTVASPTATLSASTTTPPAAAASLPNTGASDVLGVFSGASLLGGAGHYLVRRYRR